VKGEIEREITDLDIEKIDFDDKELLKRLFLLLLNRIELLAQENRLLRKENQLLKDEIAHIKGEKGIPNIPSNVPPREKSPKTVKQKKWSKRSKNPEIKIDREVHIEVDKTILPSDAVCAGERKVIIQNIAIKTDDVAYHLQRYYSRLASTYANRDGLLKVLDYPFVPIHNNAAEIAIREGVIKRKISYGTRSELGKRAWENMFSIMDTCRKQGVNFFHYPNGMFSSQNDLPRLANLIYNTA
jgi:hypothetical protein